MNFFSGWFIKIWGHLYFLAGNPLDIPAVPFLIAFQFFGFWSILVLFIVTGRPRPGKIGNLKVSVDTFPDEIRNPVQDAIRQLRFKQPPLIEFTEELTEKWMVRGILTPVLLLEKAFFSELNEGEKKALLISGFVRLKKRHSLYYLILALTFFTVFCLWISLFFSELLIRISLFYPELGSNFPYSLLLGPVSGPFLSLFAALVPAGLTFWVVFPVSRWLLVRATDSASVQTGADPENLASVLKKTRESQADCQTNIQAVSHVANPSEFFFFSGRIAKLENYRHSFTAEYLSQVPVLISVALLSGLLIFSAFYLTRYSDFSWKTNRELGLHFCYNDCPCHQMKDPGKNRISGGTHTGKVVRIPFFPSKYTESRTVDVWLPEKGPADSNLRYPVLYMQNGQNLFDPSTSYIGVDLGADEAVTRLCTSGISPGIIVVGIHHTSYSFMDYLPEKPFYYPESEEFSKTYQAEHGTLPLSDNYLRFLVRELKPYLDSHFNTKPDPENTFIAGCGMGGLISLYALCEYPGVFGGAGSFSALWTDEPPGIFPYLKDHLPSPGSHWIYLDTGTETLDRDQVPLHLAVTDLIRFKEFGKTGNIQTGIYHGDDHNEISWRKRFPVFLNFLTLKLEKNSPRQLRVETPQ